MPEYARRARLAVTIDGCDVAGELAPYLLDFTFADQAGGKSDDVQITLHNKDGRFSGAWRPKKGMTVAAAIICENWDEQGDALTLPCGAFKIDEVALSGPPDKIQIKAVSASLTSGLRDAQNTRGWENASLRAVASQIAKENSLAPMFLGEDVQFERRDQRNESDLSFLNRLANEFGFSCKAHDGKLILYDVESAEKDDSIFTICKTGDRYSPKSYSFKMSSQDADYDKAEISYTDPKTGKTLKAGANSEKASPKKADGEKRLVIQQRAENAAQAIKMSRAGLNRKNRKEQTASLECLGNPALVAGRSVELAGFGEFSGKWFIKSATHKISGSGGYSVSLELNQPAPTSAGFAKEFVREGEDQTATQIWTKPPLSFEELAERVKLTGTEADKIILCLPEIATAMASEEKGADHDGWVYLHEMFLKWFSGKPNNDPFACNYPFFIPWQWFMSFRRFLDKYAIIKEDSYLFSANAKKLLVDRLERDVKFSNTHEVFNYISDDWRKWKKDYFQSIPVPRQFIPYGVPDGLEASMGSFRIYALADGYTFPSDGGHEITIESVALVVIDSFNFRGQEGYGYWRCKPPAFSWGYEAAIPGSGYQEMTNARFAKFAKNFGIGHDFLVLSDPQRLEMASDVVYETEL